MGRLSAPVIQQVRQVLQGRADSYLYHCESGAIRRSERQRFRACNLFASVIAMLESLDGGAGRGAHWFLCGWIHDISFLKLAGQKWVSEKMNSVRLSCAPGRKPCPGGPMAGIRCCSRWTRREVPSRLNQAARFLRRGAASPTLPFSYNRPFHRTRRTHHGSRTPELPVGLAGRPDHPGS